MTINIISYNKNDYNSCNATFYVLYINKTMKFIDILYFTTNIQDKLYQQRKYPIENFPKLKKKKKKYKDARSQTKWKVFIIHF